MSGQEAVLGWRRFASAVGACPNCGHESWTTVHGHAACSRACALQLEWADQRPLAHEEEVERERSVA